jgi:hypothetical protein
MNTDTLTKTGRAGALAAAPLGALLLAVAVAKGASEEISMAAPSVIAANVFGLAATVALLLGLVWVHLRTRAPLGGHGALGMTISVVGAALVVGSAWSAVFVAPAIDLAHPGLVTEPLGGVLAGYMISHAVLAIGILAWAIPARRSQVISRSAAAVLIAGAIVCLAPLPARFLVVAAGLLVVAVQDRASATDRVITTADAHAQ